MAWQIRRRRREEPALAAAVPEVAAEWVYPPRDPGLPARPPEELLRAAAPRLARLRELVAGEPGGFDAAWQAPLAALAREVHLLPASADAHYAAPGGLFHCAFDVAFHALQAAGGHVFRAGAGQGHALEPRWRYAVFLAGLAWPVQRTLARLLVVDAQGCEWAPLAGPLWDWLQQRKATRYHACWLQAPAAPEPAATALLERITPRPRLAWLGEGDAAILRALHGEGDGAAVLQLVERMAARVLHADAAQQRRRYGRLTVGCQPEPWLLDALRAVAASGAWPLNQPGSPLWWGRDGLFLQWPAAQREALDALEARGWAGGLRSPWSWAECLGRAGAVRPAAGGGWLHDVRLPGAGCAHALGFVEPACLLGLQHGPVLADALLAASADATQTLPPPPALRWLPPMLHPGALQLAQAYRDEGDRVAQGFAWGWGLRVDALARHSAAPLAAWVRALEGQGWLVHPPGGAPGARVHPLPFGHEVAQAVALSAAGATALGLRWAEPPP